MNAAASQVLPLAFEDAIAPEADPAVRAVWQTLFAPHHPGLTFEQAMTRPLLRMGILNASEYRLREMQRHRITPHKGER